MNVLQLVQFVHLITGVGSRGNTAKPGTVPVALTGQTDELQELIEWVLKSLTNFQVIQRWPWLIKRGTLPFVAGTATSAARTTLTDYREWVPFVEHGRRYVLRYLTADGSGSNEQRVWFMDYDQFRGYWDRNPVASGPPMFFTIRPDTVTWEVYPTPDAGYTLRLDYLCQPKIYTTADAAVDLEDYPVDNLGFPVEFHEVVAWYAIRYWAETRNKPDMYVMADRRFKELMGPLKSRYLPSARI